MASTTNLVTKSFACAILLIAAGSSFSQANPNAPQDKPGAIKRDEVQSFEEAIKPYVEKARRTYPDARKRFLDGLPAKHIFFVTTRLRDATGRFEQAFIAVREIKDDKISGLIRSDIQLVSGYKYGDSYTFPDSELIDWTISRPDGTEEGNFVGKFLDTYKPGPAANASSWKNQPVTPERINQRIEQASVQVNGPVPRGILYDIAYPRDNAELESLGGHAVILLTSLTHDRNELPLQRVYVSLDGQEIELKQIKLVLSEQTDANRLSVKMFGAFRADALYLLPAYLRLRPGSLIADFAGGQTLKVANFGTPVSADVAKLNIKPSTSAPANEVVEQFIRREYPDFFGQ